MHGRNSVAQNNLGLVGSHRKDFGGEAVLKQMPAALAWLAAKGLNALNSRYARYERDIDAFFSSIDPTSLEGRAAFAKLTNSYKECLNLIIIYKAFRDEQSKGFWDRLSKVTDGQDHPELNEAGPSRDFLFELLIAARMSLSGYQIDFDKVTDVVAKTSDFLILGECKRLSSEGRFEANFKKAGKQIITEAETIVQKAYGLVFLDVSACLPPVKAELINSETVERTMHQAIEDFVERNKSKIDQLTERFANSSLGVCLIGQTPAWTQDGTLQLATRTRVIAPLSLSDKDFESLNTIMQGFSRSLLSVV